jgi:hypothetical protein
VNRIAQNRDGNEAPGPSFNALLPMPFRAMPAVEHWLKPRSIADYLVSGKSSLSERRIAAFTSGREFPMLRHTLVITNSGAPNYHVAQ